MLCVLLIHSLAVGLPLAEYAISYLDKKLSYHKFNMCIEFVSDLVKSFSPHFPESKF